MNQPTTEFDVLAAFRADFPALKKWAYMDVAGRGVPSATTRAALDAHMNERMYEGGDKDRMFALIERARWRFAELINADADEVTYTKNIDKKWAEVVKAAGTGNTVKLIVGNVSQTVQIGTSLKDADPGALVVYRNNDIDILRKWMPDEDSYTRLYRSGYLQFSKPDVGAKIKIAE